MIALAQSRDREALLPLPPTLAVSSHADSRRHLASALPAVTARSFIHSCRCRDPAEFGSTVKWVFLSDTPPLPVKLPPQAVGFLYLIYALGTGTEGFSTR